MKKLTILCFILLLTSCSNKMEITNKGVGQFKLGTILENSFNKQELDITLNSNKEIKTIIVTSIKYKTKDGFGVGTKIQEIKNKYENALLNENFSASKGETPIIDLGKSIIHDSIMFVDQNKDDMIDYVLIHKDDN